MISTSMLILEEFIVKKEKNIYLQKEIFWKQVLLDFILQLFEISTISIEIPFFEELVCCEECDPTELYFVPTKVYLEQAPYPTDSDENGSHWLKTMLQGPQISTQGLEKFHYHGQIFHIQFAGLHDTLESIGG